MKRKIAVLILTCFLAGSFNLTVLAAGGEPTLVLNADEQIPDEQIADEEEVIEKETVGDEGDENELDEEMIYIELVEPEEKEAEGLRKEMLLMEDDEQDDIDTLGASVLAKGTCGDKLKWSLNTAGTLTISGTGEMQDYGEREAPWYAYKDKLKKLELKKGVTRIGNYAFYECSEFTGGLIIPNTVTVIGTGAFYGCYGFDGELVLPEGLTELEDSAFGVCRRFTGELVIPDTVKRIGTGAFFQCMCFRGGLVLPKGLKVVEERAFCECYGFHGKLTLPEGLEIIEERAFQACPFIGDLILPDTVTTVGEAAFEDCRSLNGKLKLSSQLTTIELGAFLNCGKLTGDLIIPEGVKSIGYRTFYNCVSFTGDLVIPNSVEIIGKEAFNNCSGFEGELILPKNVKSIEDQAFLNCHSLTGTLTIPASLQTIGNDVFQCCDGITRVINKSKVSIKLPVRSENSSNAYWVKEGKTKEIFEIGKGTALLMSERGIWVERDVINVFDDMKLTDWFLDAVQYVYERDIMTGTGTSFKPNDRITREQFVQVLYSTSGKPGVSAKNNFSDVKNGEWYTNAIIWASSKGIVSGVGNGRFGVGQNITREQMVLMLYKYAQINKYSMKTTRNKYASFADGASVSTWARDAIDWAFTQGVISGKTGNKLDPQGTATRAECATMIMRLLQVNEK